ncbi:MAG: DUF3857 and transglutaminase domain-containing protein [Thermoanaerobaculia bacterium]|nr:DUF3857 and transglutaminase domain-containing protein [Thermoanaerobaculia bacterium]
MIIRVFLALLLLPLPALARSYGEFDVAPPAGWTDTVAVDYAAKVTPEAVRFGLYDLLADHQIRVTGRGWTHYFRTVRKVLSTSGVQNASELSIAFDPSYQRLILHEVSIVRGGQRINALDPGKVRVIDDEDDAESQIYSGNLNALIFLSDVRPGDVIDYAWSVDGANPILRGRFASELELGSSLPTKQIRHRIIWPEARTLRHAGAKPQISTGGGDTIYVWERLDGYPIEFEDDTPSWYDAWETVELTEFASWQEVAQWSAPMFRPDQESIAAIRKFADEIRAKHADPAARTTAAIRFVQDEIRYLGIEIGENSHRPRQPSQTLAQRWGDCKEKAFVLSLLLRELGVTAEPALVSTRLRQMLDRRLPSPFAFDHVIVRVASGGKTHWIDPTISQQGGTIETIDTPDDRRALVVGDTTTALAEIPAATHGRIVVDQTYIANTASMPTSLAVCTTYTGAEADSVRTVLSGMSGTDLARERINHFAADHPQISQTAPPQIDDDRDKNVVVIRERYSIRGMWKKGSWTFYPRDVDRYLTRPGTVIRSMPLATNHPLDVRQRTIFRFPANVTIEPDQIAHNGPSIGFSSAIRANGPSIIVETSLRSLRDSIEPREVPAHLETINSIRETIGVTIPATFEQPAGSEFRQKVSEASAAMRWSWSAALLAAISVGALGVVQMFRSWWN